jgi:hypothetical protein
MFARIWTLQLVLVTELPGVSDLCVGGVFDPCDDDVITGDQDSLEISHPDTSVYRKHVSLRVKCLLLLSSFNQNWNVPINFSGTPQ